MLPADPPDDAAPESNSGGTALPVTVGPLDEGTLRPARMLSLAKVGALAAVVVVVLVGVYFLAPQLAAGLGAIDNVSARVVDVRAVSPAAPGSGAHGDGCAAQLVSVAWGSGETGAIHWCATDGNPAPTAGSTVRIWALGGWRPVPAGHAGIWTAVAIVFAAVLLAALVGAAWCLRDVRALAAVRRGAVRATCLTGRVERLVIGRGVFHKEGRSFVYVHVVDQNQVLPRLQAPGPADRSLLGARVRVHALRTTRRGRPAGPYVVVRTGRTSGTRVMLGRAARCRSGSGAGSDAH